MIQTYTLTTSEIDRPEQAVADIERQLAGLAIRTHSVGLVVCHYDYVELGVVGALMEALPFPLMGATSFYQATPKVSGLFELTITLMTSDDVRFTLAHSTGEYAVPEDQRVANTYRRAYEVTGQRPALIFSALSADRPMSGDQYLRLLDEASGGVPCFGVVNSGEDENAASIFVICDGGCFSEGFALLLMTGPVVPHMHVSEVDPEHLLSVSSTVTEADGVFVRSLNGHPAGEHLGRNGVTLDDRTSEFLSIPFYWRMPGEAGLTGRTLKTIHPDGSLEFMAEVPEGAILRVGTATAKDILEETELVIRRAVAASPGTQVCIMGSCVGRFITLGLDITEELERAIEVLPQGVSYLAAYVGGELCPIESDGRLVNRYHNNSFIVLTLTDA